MRPAVIATAHHGQYKSRVQVLAAGQALGLDEETGRGDVEVVLIRGADQRDGSFWRSAQQFLADRQACVRAADDYHRDAFGHGDGRVGDFRSGSQGGRFEHALSVLSMEEGATFRATGLEWII